MTTYGPHVAYTDPRIYGLVAGYAWGPHQREMLLGTRPWPNTAQPNLVSMITCLRERGMQVGIDGDGVGRIHMDGLPHGDDLLDLRLAQWGIAIPRVTVLSLNGPFDEVGNVPVFQGTVSGRTERSDGVRRDGLHDGAWIVGRQDVLITYRRDDNVEPWWDHAGPAVVGNRAVRGTLRRARNTATSVAAYVAHWDEWRAWKARKDAEAAEALRRAAEAMEPVDEQLAAVAF